MQSTQGLSQSHAGVRLSDSGDLFLFKKEDKNE